MPGLVAPMADILERLSALIIMNQQKQEIPVFARVWNDQFRKKEEGIIEYQPLPATYLEVIVSDDYGDIGVAVFSGDLIFRIHIGHENYDNGGNTYAQDLEVYSIRDKVIGLLQHFKPAGCGVMTYIHEEPNFNHAQVYEYIVDFICNFTDYSGSPLRPDSGAYITIPGPVELEKDIEIRRAGIHQLQEQCFNIPKIPK